MTAPENTRERLAEALRKCQMVPYDDGKGGWLFRAARPEEQTGALLPLIDTLLREQRDGIAAAIEALLLVTYGPDPSTERLTGYIEARTFAARIARTFGGER